MEMLQNSSQSIAISRLILAGSPDSDLHTIGQLLRGAGLDGKDASGTGAELELAVGEKALDILLEKVTKSPRAFLLLAYRDPVPVIAEAIAEGSDPADALATWLSWTTDLLAAFRRARRQIVLFESIAAMENPAELINQLGQRLGLSLYRPLDKPSISPQGEVDPVHVLIGESLIRRDFKARRMVAELEAAALPLVSRTGLAALDIPKVLHIYREQSRLSASQFAALKAECNQLRAEVEGLQRKLADAADSAELKKLKSENDLFLRQLHEAQDQAERFYLDNQRLHAGVEQAEKHRDRIQHLERRIRYFENSRSWKITAPFRAVVKFFRRSDQKKTP